MAVDANVLIFERIKEEMKVGKTVRAAIDAGFSNALSSILDANITTLIAALFLFQFGTGPIRGFAVTLSIGILGTLFCAIFVSRFLFDLVYTPSRKSQSDLDLDRSPGTQTGAREWIFFAHQHRFHEVPGSSSSDSRSRSWSSARSRSFFLGKLNLGIDFVGGTQLTLKFAAEPDVSEIRDILGRAGLKESQIQRFGKPGENEILVRTPIVEGTEEGAATRILEALSQHYNKADAAADLNQIGTASIAQLLVAANPDGVTGEPEAIAAHYTAVAESVMGGAQEVGDLPVVGRGGDDPGVSASRSRP